MTIKMNPLRVKTTVMAMAMVGMTAMSCKDGKKADSTGTTPSEMSQEDTTTSNDLANSNLQHPESEKILADYMVLKDALVETNEEAAKKAGKQLEGTLKSFSVESYSAEQQNELKDIVAAAAEQAGQIGNSTIENQREHFELLTEQITNMVTVTGTKNTLYQQFCPMYAADGGTWLSMEKNIRNPYFGSKMMKCGEVQKEIN